MHNHFFSIFYIFPFAFNFLIMTFFIDVWLAAILEIVINDAEVRDDFGLRRSFQLLLSKRWLRFRGFNRGVISFRSYIHVHIITVSLSCSNEYDFSWDQVCSNKQSNVWVCVYNSQEFSQWLRRIQTHIHTSTLIWTQLLKWMWNGRQPISFLQCMEDRFCHQINIKKGIVTFYLTILTFLYLTYDDKFIYLAILTPPPPPPPPPITVVYIRNCKK